MGAASEDFQSGLVGSVGLETSEQWQQHTFDAVEFKLAGWLLLGNFVLAKVYHDHINFNCPCSYQCPWQDRTS